MSFTTEYNNMFGGVAGEVIGDLDTDYIRSSPVPITLGGITAGTYTPSGSIADTLDKLLYPYQNPTVSLTSNVSTSTRQKGLDTINGMTLTATCTKKSSPLLKVEFYMGDTLLDTQEYVDTNVFTYEYTGTVADTTTFSAKVYDNKSKTGTSSLTYNFYYPNFSAVTTNEVLDVTMDEIASGTMRLEAKANKTLTFTGTMARYIFCYPASWGTLSSIVDNSGYEYINSFQRVSLTYTSGTENVPMYAYISKTSATLSSYKYTFKF